MWFGFLHSRKKCEKLPVYADDCILIDDVWNGFCRFNARKLQILFRNILFAVPHFNLFATISTREHYFYILEFPLLLMLGKLQI